MRFPVIHPLLLSALILAACYAPAAHYAAYENGFWFDGEEFIEATFYSRDGIFVRNKPSRIDTTIDLEGGYAIPPFGEAHSHHYDTPALLETVNELSLRDGVFYGMSMTNWVHTKDEVLPFFGQNHTIDVAFAD
ncbi:MAG: hypothetical protein ACFCU6_07780, partial [Balneolaceae bacterium]